MAIVTAKVVTSGHSQVIRLPETMRLDTNTVQIEKMGSGLLIIDSKKEAKRLKALRELYGSCPEFSLT